MAQIATMIEPVPESWPVYKLGHRHMVLSAGKKSKSSFVDAERLEWCWAYLGTMAEGGWIDQGSWMCFVDPHSAALYDMTWSSSA